MLANAPETLRKGLFIVLALCVVAFILNLIRKTPNDQHLLLVALSCVVGGAFGNLTDRIHVVYVADFVHWYVGTNVWPTFNVADCFICIGAGLLAITQFREFMAERATKRVAPSAGAEYGSDRG
mgnify:CR=1 FL=1